MIVPNGVAIAQFTVPPDTIRTALAHALGLDKGPVIAYVGTIALHNHPVDLLIAAFAQVVLHHPTARLLIIGGGEDLAAVQANVARQPWRDRVIFTGHVPHATVRGLLALADLSVDPVYDDAVARARSPLKLIESLALGVPVITGDVGDRAEMLDFGAAGMVVRPGDAQALAIAINELLADPVRRMAMAAAAVAQARRYDWDRLGEQWIRVYPSRPTGRG